MGLVPIHPNNWSSTVLLTCSSGTHINRADHKLSKMVKYPLVAIKTEYQRDYSLVLTVMMVIESGTERSAHLLCDFASEEVSQKRHKLLLCLQMNSAKELRLSAP